MLCSCFVDGKRTLLGPLVTCWITSSVKSLLDPILGIAALVLSIQPHDLLGALHMFASFQSQGPGRMLKHVMGALRQLTSLSFAVKQILFASLCKLFWVSQSAHWEGRRFGSSVKLWPKSQESEGGGCNRRI